MPRLLINYSDRQQRDEQYGVGGCYGGQKENIVWCWDTDGEPPVKVDLGYMERIEKIEPVKDENGKQLYAIIKEGEHKATARKVPLQHLVTYLRNKKIGKTKPSIRPPKPIPLE